MPALKSPIRARYSLAVSTGYVLVGIVIIVRSLVAHVLPLILLGAVFIALGAVRVRDYLAWRRSFRDS
ncbi:MAG: hypothetical protein ACR2GA_01780 [Chloroflexota bacterium]